MTETLRSKPLTDLPRHTFVGPNRDNRFLTDLGEYYLDTTRDDVPFFPERKKTQEELEILLEMNGAISEYAQDLGVDISDRIPSSTRVLLYDDDEFKKLKTSMKMPADWVGWWARPFVMTTRPSLDKGWGVTALGHELIHAVGFTGNSISLEGSEATVNQTRRGYAVSGETAFNMLDEGVVELMSREVATKYWPKYPSLRKTTYKMDAYSEVIPVVTSMVTEAAERLGQSREDLWRTLARGELTGDMKVLRQFTDAFGHDGMKAIAEYKDGGARSAGRVALQLGLDIKPRRKGWGFKKS